MSLSSIADAQNAVRRLYAVFEAETQDADKTMDEHMQHAVIMEDGEFTWDSPPPQAAEKSKKKSGSSRQSAVITQAAVAEPQKVFGMKDVNLTIPMGQLTAIVGRYHFALSRIAN